MLSSHRFRQLPQDEQDDHLDLKEGCRLACLTMIQQTWIVNPPNYRISLLTTPHVVFLLLPRILSSTDAPKTRSTTDSNHDYSSRLRTVNGVDREIKFTELLKAEGVPDTHVKIYSAACSVHHFEVVCSDVCEAISLACGGVDTIRSDNKVRKRV